MSNIGTRIKYTRESKGISCRALARMARVSLTYLNEVENSKKTPSIEYLQKLDKVLGSDLAKYAFSPNRLKLIEDLAKDITTCKGYDLDWSDIDMTQMAIAINADIEADIFKLVKDFINTR